MARMVSMAWIGRWRSWLACLLLAHGGLVSAAVPPSSLRVVYPAVESERDGRTAYPVALLELALARSGVRYRLQSSPTPMQQSRSLRMLESRRGLDVLWTVSTEDRERRLRPIRIPIDRGLIGWRVLLIRDREQARFADVRSAIDLRRFRYAQGHDWPDLQALRANGLQVEACPTYEGLFGMLARRHVDAVPRSVTEAPAEAAARPGAGLQPEPALLLHYVSPLYFFVHRDDAALAAAIERGLESSLQDGSFQRLFEVYHGPAIAELARGDRRVIALENPTLPARTPVARRALWFAPGEAR